MKNKKIQILIAITGASGSIYAKSLLQKLQILQNNNNFEVSLVFSEMGKQVCRHELGDFFIAELVFKIFDNSNFNAGFASGSSPADIMIIIPSSMGTLGRIAHGYSDSLITRAADVCLKERKKLILVTRESPLNLIHIKNMELISLSGGIIFPASPSFYSNPNNIDELVDNVTNRLLDLIEIKTDYKRWGEDLSL